MRCGFERGLPMRALESHQLTILTTDKCTAACEHCSMNSSPKRRARLSLDQIRRHVDEAAGSTGIRLIIFAGGEPLLLGDDLFAAIEHVRHVGLKSRLITNAYWATSADRATRVVTRLHACGLDELNLSIDDYHLPFIKPRHVKLAFDAARSIPFDCVILVHCSGPTTHFNEAELDALVGEHLPRMYNDDREAVRFGRASQRPFLAVSNSTLQALGRGTTLDLGSDPPASGWEEKARSIGGCPCAVRSPAIAPSGHLVACCGFEVAGNPVLDIGDLELSSLTSLLDQADSDLLLNMIALEGPFAIMDQLKERDRSLPFKASYRTFCELCQDIVTRPELQRALVELMPSRAPFILARRGEFPAASAPILAPDSLPPDLP
jgi:hypothetical protein